MQVLALLLSALVYSNPAFAVDDEGQSLTPDARGRVAPDRNFDLERLRLDVQLLPAEQAVSGVATYSVRRLWEGPLVLHQLALEIESVQVGETPVPFWTEGERLLVDLGERDQVELTIRWRAVPRTGLHFREAGRGSPDAYDEIWSQGEGQDNRHWFPGWDYPNDRFVYEGEVRGPEGWLTLTNTGVDLVNYLVMVAAAPYDLHAHPEAPELTVYMPPGTRDDVVDRLLLPVLDMRTWLEQRTGVPYAWGDYRQVFVQRFLYGGMENTSATINSDRLLGSRRVYETRPWDVSVVAHELAHQWYGDLLTCDGWRELWLNEGFASFFAADWMSLRLGEEWFPGVDPEAMYAGSVRSWRKAALGSAVLAGRFHQGPDAPANSKVYVKGAMTLQMLRVMLGEERFWAGIAAYTRGHQRELVETRDLQEAMESVSGRELDWFFQQWTELPTTPELTVSHSFDGEKLTIKVKQSTSDRPAFTMPVTVSVGTVDGPQRVSGWLEDEDLDLELPLSAAPLYVAFDPDGGLLATVTQEQDPAAWAAQLTAPEALARFVAMDALAETERGEELAVLLGDETLDPISRALAAEALGKQRAASLLLPHLDAKHAYVRSAVAEALGSCPGDDVAGALSRAVLGDPNPDVQGEALRALAKNQPVRALGLARRLTSSSGIDEDKRADAAFDVIGEHGVNADLGALLAEGRPRRLGASALGAAAKLVLREADDKKREQLAERVTRVAVAGLDDLDLRGRQRAMGVLESVGTRAGVDPLERYLREERVPEAVEAARRAILAIRGRQAVPEQRPNDLEARLKALEGRLEELESERDQWMGGG